MKLAFPNTAIIIHKIIPLKQNYLVRIITLAIMHLTIIKTIIITIIAAIITTIKTNWMSYLKLSK